MAQKVLKKSSTRAFSFTFPDSGVTVQLRKVNPYLAAEARSAMSKDRPQPPTRIVTEEGPLKGREEVMDRDPEYIKKLREWEAKVEEKLMLLQIRRGVVSIDVENWREEVAQLREDMAEIGVADSLPEDDAAAYICYIASATANDLQDFITTLATRSQPSSEEVDIAKESFPTDVAE